MNAKTYLLGKSSKYDGGDLVSYLLGKNSSGGGETFKYVQNGLVAWFDESEPFDNNEHWNNKVEGSNDYIYVKARASGSANPYIKNANQPLINDGNYTFASSKDYYIKGYTIEIVGSLAGTNTGGNGGWFVTGNINGTAGIGMRSTSGNTGILEYINLANPNSSNNAYRIDFNEVVGSAVCLYDIPERSNTSRYKPTVKGSIHGNGFLSITANGADTFKTKGSELLFLAYYETQYRASGLIKCIRIYNRELTDEELAYNHNIDVNRFNLAK